MRDLIQLLLDRTVERWMTMAMKIDPDGRDPIEIPLSFRIDQIRPFPTLDDERFFLFPFLHLGEGMPEVPVIPINQLSNRRLWWHAHVEEVVVALIVYGEKSEKVRRACQMVPARCGADYTRERLL